MTAEMERAIADIGVIAQPKPKLWRIEYPAGWTPKHKGEEPPFQGETEMRIRDIIGDIIAVIALFGIGYGALLIGHGFGLQ